MIENAGKGKTIVKNADKNSKSVIERETVAVENTVWRSFAKFLSLVSLPF